MGDGMQVVYLDVSHVLHPSVSTYVLVHGKSPWRDGHTKYEHLAVVEGLLEPYPDVRIVLSDWTPVVHETGQVVERLGTLAKRVVGSLYNDMTTKVRRVVPLRSGGEREIGYSPDDFRRMSRAQAVRAHAAWSKLQGWVAVTSDYFDWTPEERAKHVVITDMLDALGTSAAQRAFSAALAANFHSELQPPKAPMASKRVDLDD